MVDFVASINHTALQHPWLAAFCGALVGYFAVRRHGEGIALTSAALTAAGTAFWVWRNS